MLASERWWYICERGMLAGRDRRIKTYTHSPKIAHSIKRAVVVIAAGAG